MAIRMGKRQPTSFHSEKREDSGNQHKIEATTDRAD